LTEQREAKAMVHPNTANLSFIETSLLNSLPQPVIVVGVDGNVIGFSPAAKLLFPVLRDLQPLSFAIRDPQLLDAVALTSSDGLRRTLDILERLPVQRYFGIEVVRAEESIAGPAFTVIAIEDKSAHRQLEQMRVDFVANASHELRTPLASLMGFVETLKGSARRDEKARDQFLEIMEIQAKRMARLIDDLLSLSRIELNAHVQPRSPVDLVGVVRQITDALSPLAQERGMDIRLLASDNVMLVSGDRDELLRLFENLIENAIKYAASGKRADVTLERKASQKIVAEVRDYGPGIQADHLPRLTERFYRVDAAASRDAGGTGLGWPSSSISLRTIAEDWTSAACKGKGVVSGSRWMPSVMHEFPEPALISWKCRVTPVKGRVILSAT
jgi:two-component system, OmpR family, phosphate regulon sensor histidine kinase PhoR